MTPDCLFLRNPFGGGIGSHGESCARIQAHTDEEIRINAEATHHALYGVSKEHPHGSVCLNVCGSCASKAEKRGAIVSEGVITCSTT